MRFSYTKPNWELLNLRKHTDGSGSREQWNMGYEASAAATNQRNTL